MLKLIQSLILIILLSLSGCGIVYYFKYGVTPRKNEPHKQQIEYLVSEGFDTLNVFSIKCSYMDSLSDEKFAMNAYKLETGASAAAVQIRMYRNNGLFITGWTQCMGGNPRAHGMLDSLPMYSPPYLTINYNLHMYSDLDLFDISKLEKASLIEQSQNTDYTIVIFWAEWTGSFSDKTFADVYDYISKYPEVDFLILKLNTATFCDSK